MLSRFHKAQSSTYEGALAEIKSGFKESHWMWFVFPQLKGLGFSEMADYYGINGLAEARAYLADDILRSRLIEISQALLELKTNDADEVLGYPDDLKLKSCMTLFHLADNSNPIFKDVIDKFFNGVMDQKTIELTYNLVDQIIGIIPDNGMDMKAAKHDRLIAKNSIDN